MTQNEMPKIEAITPPEQGRSMVEMLGTLAIMGVLSIGGIAGYNYAIDKYRANETIDELNSRAIVYATQLENGDLLSGTILRNGEFGDRTSLGYRISATVSEYENEFNVAVNGVPFEVCEQILKNYKIPTEISVNGNIYNDVDENIDICGEGDTNMIFAFNGDLSNDWESVEVSGEPNNGETTAIMTETGSYSYTESTTGTLTITQTPTVTHSLSPEVTISGTPGSQDCNNMPYGSDYVKQAEEYCASRGNVVHLEEVGCPFDEVNTAQRCDAFKDIDEGYYALGATSPYLVNIWGGYANCLVGYYIAPNWIDDETWVNSNIGNFGGSLTPLCWDDYRAMLSEESKGNISE